MYVYLIRHTSTDTPRGLCYGRTDVPLTANYTAERDDVLRRLRGLRADLDRPEPRRIYASPSTRCRLLAKDLSQEFSTAKLTEDPRLMELNFGAWENRMWDEIQTNDGERLRAWGDDFVNTRCPGGESTADLQRRATAAWSEIIATSTGNTGEESDAILVAHGGSIRAILVNILGMRPKDGFALAIERGRIAAIRADGAGVKLLRLNV